MLFLESRCQNVRVETPGDRLTRLIQTHVDASGGRYKSVRAFIEAAGLSSGGWSSWKSKNKSDPSHEITDAMLKAIAKELGVSHFELYRRIHPPAPAPGDRFPNRTMAADIARDLGFSEDAIRAVLSENAKADGSRWYWLLRIEAEEERAAPIARREAF